MIEVESYIQSKTGNSSLCEDYKYMDENFAAVIDGVSTKTKVRYQGRTTGQAAALLVAEAIGNLNKEATAFEAALYITNHIKKYYMEHGIYEKVKRYPAQRVAAVSVIYSSYYRQVWLIGDCQCLVDGKVYSNPQKIDEITSEVRSLYLKQEILKGKTMKELLIKDTGREYISELLNNQSLFENNISHDDYCYSVFDGFPIPKENIKVIDVPLDAGYVVLASDGYPYLKDTLKESEEQLEFVLQNDPLCMNIYKSSKGLVSGNVSYDDRTYLKIGAILMTSDKNERT